MALLSFEEAIAHSEQYAKRHLLLGNGFSIACRADIFHYGSLFAQADFSAVPEVIKVFEALGTQDFEIAIRSLENAAQILPAYIDASADPQVLMIAHAAALKEILLQTIAANHPRIPGEISDAKFWACRSFLAHFAMPGGGQIYSLNYDLLLYWTLMHEDMPFSAPVLIEKTDGFGNDEDAPDADYVVWQGETAAHSACIHFLHGALHLFDSGAELKKYTWVRKQEPLIEQARSAIEGNAFPLFVAEGSSAQKKDKIRHNAYLYQGFKQLTVNAGRGNHCFFIFGHSLAANDDHILNRLARGKFPHLYIGIYGDPLSADNERIMNRAQELSGLRSLRYPLQISFYDAKSANVWGAA
ncbi:MAG: DUF4917 family protein [Brevundimonas sp.]|uniref:DUF4917 family protein n=1 Tax=Brevundimonas sp. TaxID=1871086 RepID=UPI00248710B6|nr:DUF4917 family protein [Brevundimonas sp.]MDI1327526.1 DUF4917 family protein [Brevundimonas sp.]